MISINSKVSIVSTSVVEDVDVKDSVCSSLTDVGEAIEVGSGI